MNKAWLAKAGDKANSGDHQDYLFGNPLDRNAPTLDQEAELAFRKQYTDRAAEYDQNERARAYDEILDDPAYRESQERITARTNTDSDVSSALKSGRDWGRTWDRAHMRERIHGMNDFVRQYPEKAQAYAKRWNVFAEKNPEIKDMNNAQWDAWCSEHPGTFSSIGEYRNIARAVDHVERKQEMDRIQPQVHESYTKIAEIRGSIDVTETPRQKEEKTPLSEQKESLNNLQLEDVASEIRASIPAEIQSADRDTLLVMKKECADLRDAPGEGVREILD